MLTREQLDKIYTGKTGYRIDYYTLQNVICCADCIRSEYDMKTDYEMPGANYFLVRYKTCKCGNKVRV